MRLLIDALDWADFIKGGLTYYKLRVLQETQEIRERRDLGDTVAPRVTPAAPGQQVCEEVSTVCREVSQLHARSSRDRRPRKTNARQDLQVGSERWKHYDCCLKGNGSKG